MMSRRNRRRPAARHGMSGNTLFGSTGWLFADLLLALALAFLLATTVNTPPPAPPHPPGPTASQTPTPTPSATKGPPQQALDLTPVPVTLTIDPSNVSSGAIRQKILSVSTLRGQHAGLVLIFAGGDVSSSSWGQIDTVVWGILKKMTPLFYRTVPLQYWGGGPPTQVLLKIYLFRKP